MGGVGGGLTAFQLEAAQLFFAQPASSTFLLAGGGALLANGLGSRPTQDLDFFTRPGGGGVSTARDEFIAAASVRGWRVDVIRDTDTFVRLVVHDVEDLLVDLATDSAPGRPPTVTVAGPTYAPEELAGRKVVALFDRAEARDFVDVFALARVYDRERLLRSAVEVDAGFDRVVFADMLDSIVRYRDIDLQLGRRRRAGPTGLCCIVGCRAARRQMIRTDGRRALGVGQRVDRLYGTGPRSCQIRARRGVSSWPLVSGCAGPLRAAKTRGKPGKQGADAREASVYLVSVKCQRRWFNPSIAHHLKA